ncbi:hypothetical protein BH11BAC6_BH11BAC6_15440 [soil metagenome]
MNNLEIHTGDSLTILPTLTPESIQCCVTSRELNRKAILIELNPDYAKMGKVRARTLQSQLLLNNAND